MKKTIARRISVAASWLPVVKLQTKTKTLISGEKLIAAGTLLINGVRVDPSLVYSQYHPVFVNHENMLKAAYKRNGIHGIEAYLDKYRDHLDKVREYNKTAENA